MSVCKLVVYRKKIDVESRAIFVHCTVHTLNLVVQETMQNIDKIQDFLSALCLLIAFVKDLLKRRAMFNSLQAELSELSGS